MPADEVHREFKEYLPLIAPKAELLHKLGVVAAESAEANERARTSRRHQTKGALKRVNHELKELIQMRTQRLISDEEFKAHRTDLLTRRHSIEAVLSPARFRTAEIRERLSEIAAPLHVLLDTWTALLPRLRSRFQRLIIPFGFIVRKVRTAELGLLFRTISGLAQAESTEVALTGDEWNQIYKELLEVHAMAELRAELFLDQVDPTEVPARKRRTVITASRKKWF